MNEDTINEFLSALIKHTRNSRLQWHEMCSDYHVTFIANYRVALSKELRLRITKGHNGISVHEIENHELLRGLRAAICTDPEAESQKAFTDIMMELQRHL